MLQVLPWLHTTIVLAQPVRPLYKMSSFDQKSGEYTNPSGIAQPSAEQGPWDSQVLQRNVTLGFPAQQLLTVKKTIQLTKKENKQTYLRLIVLLFSLEWVICFKHTIYSRLLTTIIF